MDVFSIFHQFSYFGIFFLLVLVNTAPILMPPTWLILVSFYALDETLNLVLLAVVGATGATAGRFVLLCTSGFFRKFMSEERKSIFDGIANYLKSKKFGYFILSFLFAATPLPSNMLFIGYGLMRAKSVQIYLGFWLGRAISYYVMISISKFVLIPFTKLFEDRLLGIVFVDVVSVIMLVFFACVNWNTLITQRKVQFVKPKFWKL